MILGGILIALGILFLLIGFFCVYLAFFNNPDGTWETRYIIGTIIFWFVGIGEIWYGCRFFNSKMSSPRNKAQEQVLQTHRHAEDYDLPTLPKNYQSQPTESASLNITESDLDNNFERFTWQEMEDIVGELFKKKRYVVQVGMKSQNGTTKRTGDFGIDVRARNDLVNIGIQVKHHSSDIDFDTVAKTIGVSQDYDKVVIVSTRTGFTRQAIDFANKEKKLELWGTEKLKDNIRKYMKDGVFEWS